MTYPDLSWYFRSGGEAVLEDYPSSPLTNLRAFLNYSVSDDSLASFIQPGPVANYDPGGDETGFLECWKEESLEVKKFIDDVSGSEKLHANSDYKSRVIDDVREIRYIHAPLAQDLFDRVREGAASRGMKLNEKKTTILCISAVRSYEPRSYILTSTKEMT